MFDAEIGIFPSSREKICIMIYDLHISETSEYVFLIYTYDLWV